MPDAAATVAPPASAASSASPADAAAPRASDPGELDAGPRTVAPVASTSPTTPDVLPDNAFVAGYPGGAVLVYALPTDDARTSDVLLQLLSANGTKQGAPRRIRRTSGAVSALSAFVEGGVAWVGWRSQAASTDFGAVMRVALDTWVTAGPRMLGAVSALPTPGSIRVIGDGHGGALVATNGPVTAAPCMLREEPAPCRGPSIVLMHVPASYPATDARIVVTRAIDGGPVADVRGLALAGPDQVFLDIRAMHGGAVTDAVLVSLASDAGPALTPVDTTQCGLMDRTYVVGDRIVTVAEDGYWEEKNTCPMRKGPTMACPQTGARPLHAAPSADAGPLNVCTPLLSMKTRCEAGRSVAHLQTRAAEQDVPLDRACESAQPKP